MIIYQRKKIRSCQAKTETTENFYSKKLLSCRSWELLRRNGAFFVFVDFFSSCANISCSWVNFQINLAISLENCLKKKIQKNYGKIAVRENIKVSQFWMIFRWFWSTVLQFFFSRNFCPLRRPSLDCGRVSLNFKFDCFRLVIRFLVHRTNLSPKREFWFYFSGFYFARNVEVDTFVRNYFWLSKFLNRQRMVLACMNFKQSPVFTPFK